MAPLWLRPAGTSLARRRRAGLPARAVLVALAALVGLGVGVVAAGTASALSSVDAIAASLRQSPVYADPDAERPLTPAQEDALLGEVRRAGTPVFVAVLPESFVAANGGTPDAALTTLARAVGEPGTYAMVAGNRFRANSTLFPVADLATEALASNRGGTSYDVLSAFVASVGERAATQGSTAAGSTGSGSGGFPWGWVLLGGAVAGGGFLAYRASQASKARAAAALAEVKAVVDEDVTQFGEQLAAFDSGDPRLDDAGRTDLQAALDAYARAGDAAGRMTSAQQAGAVTAALADGRFAMACVEARLDGRELPQRRPPCFFDPRHGPSVEDVAWAPPGGQLREVPACAACRTMLADGVTPAGREVPVAVGAGAAGGTVPYWNAGPQFGGYAGGYYSAFGSVLPAILVGTMLGGMMSPGWGMGPAGGDAGATGMGPGAGDGGGGVDWAGGFGGGDLGGGGFGGGDFGGGDF